MLDLFLSPVFQTCETSLKHKTDLVAKLEEKTNQMAATIKELEAK